MVKIRFNTRWPKNLHAYRALPGLQLELPGEQELFGRGLTRSVDGAARHREIFHQARDKNEARISRSGKVGFRCRRNVQHRVGIDTKCIFGILQFRLRECAHVIDRCIVDDTIEPLQFMLRHQRRKFFRKIRFCHISGEQKDVISGRQTLRRRM